MEQAASLATPRNRPLARQRLSREVGAALRRARHQQQWSAAQVAARCGLSETFVCALERGDRAPSLHSARALVVGLDLPYDVARALVDESVPDAGRSR